MTTGAALIWKEWREQRWYAIAGFVTLSTIAWCGVIWGDFADTVADAQAAMTLMFGGILALVIGVAASCRDMDDRVKAFWSSRPISPAAWLDTKYLTGLTAMSIVCVAPLLLLAALSFLGTPTAIPALRFHPFAENVLAFHTFSIVLIYSISFLLGILIRRAAHAAVLSLSAGLAVYFLPLVFPPLSRFEVYHTIFDATTVGFTASHAVFICGMLAASAAAFVLAHLALARDWRLRADLRLICCVFGGVVLILIGAMGFQLGSNLKCERRIDFSSFVGKGSGWITSITMSGNRGLLVRPDSRIDPAVRYIQYRSTLWHMDLSRPEPFSSPVDVDIRFDQRIGTGERMLWSPQQPRRAYLLLHGYDGYDRVLFLYTVALDRPGGEAVIHRLDVGPHFVPPKNSGNLWNYGNTRAYLHKQEIYIYSRSCGQVLTVDIRNPDAPAAMQTLQVNELDRYETKPYEDGWGPLLLKMIPANHLSPAERLKVTLGLIGEGYSHPWPVAGEGELLVVAERDRFKTYRLSGFDKDIARFDQVGQREATPLERLAAFVMIPVNVTVKDGLAYVHERIGLTVYDVRCPERPRRVGHYAVGQGLGQVVPLPDRRALVIVRNGSGGATLDIVGPPKLDK